MNLCSSTWSFLPQNLPQTFSAIHGALLPLRTLQLKAFCSRADGLSLILKLMFPENSWPCSPRAHCPILPELMASVLPELMAPVSQSSWPLFSQSSWPLFYQSSWPSFPKAHGPVLPELMVLFPKLMALFSQSSWPCPWHRTTAVARLTRVTVIVWLTPASYVYPDLEPGDKRVVT